MKIRMVKKATVFLMATMMVIALAGVAVAVDYNTVGSYEAGVNILDTKGISFKWSGGVRTFYFRTGQQMPITGPEGDNISNPLNSMLQAITGTYSFGNVYDSSGIYSITPGVTSQITVGDGSFPNVLSATATATLINFGNNTITWQVSDAPGSVVIENTDLQSVNLANIQSNATAYSFNLTFQEWTSETAEENWLKGTSGYNGTQDKAYSSKFSGLAAAPEPAEWVLMFIGLGMLGFYLQRRGYLKFDLSPQSVA